jgi:CheY-like chemotaxis protein
MPDWKKTMTNQAIFTMLNSLCAGARDSAHALQALIEVRRDAAVGAFEPCVEAGRSSADRLLRFVDDIQHLLRDAPPAIDPGEEFDVAQSAAEAAELLNLASDSNWAVFTPPTGPVRIWQHRDAVERVLTRVLEAAVKLAPVAGEVPVTMREEPTGSRASVELSIRDASLAAELEGWLNTDPDQIELPDGSATPLAVSVVVAGRFLRACGGAVETARNTSGAVSLILGVPSQKAEESPIPQNQRYVGPEAFNVLVVDDDDESFALSERLLGQENLWRARDGLEGVDLVKRLRFDVILMDVHMPSMDGYTAIREIRGWETQTANARTPIVVLSVDDEETQRRSAARSGCSGFLRKPLRNGDVADLLGRLRGMRSRVA